MTLDNRCTWYLTECLQLQCSQIGFWKIKKSSQFCIKTVKAESVFIGSTRAIFNTFLSTNHERPSDRLLMFSMSKKSKTKNTIWNVYTVRNPWCQVTNHLGLESGIMKRKKWLPRFGCIFSSLNKWLPLLHLQLLWVLIWVTNTLK